MVKGDGTDIMCLEGWAYNDLLFYGVLVYDFVVAKIVDVYVLFMYLLFKISLILFS